MSHALILLAHGSSAPHWRVPLEHLNQALAGRHLRRDMPGRVDALAVVAAEQAGESARS